LSSGDAYEQENTRKPGGVALLQVEDQMFKERLNTMMADGPMLSMLVGDC